MQRMTDDDVDVDMEDDDKYLNLVKKHIRHLQFYSNDLMHLACDSRWPNESSFLLLTATRSKGE